MLKEASLNQIYTNHSLKATEATILKHARICAHYIITATGHKNISILQSYIQDTNNAVRKKYFCLPLNSLTAHRV